MLEKSQEYLRLAIAAAAILIGLSVAYHYVIYIPEKDREQKVEVDSKAKTEVEQTAEKNEAAQKAALNRQTNYRVCLANAQSNYSSRWDSSCKTRSAEADKNRAQCIVAGGTEESCRSYYPPLPPADCSLPNAVSDDYDAMLKEDQKRCLDEANAGVLDSNL